MRTSETGKRVALGVAALLGPVTGGAGPISQTRLRRAGSAGISFSHRRTLDCPRENTLKGPFRVSYDSEEDAGGSEFTGTGSP